MLWRAGHLFIAALAASCLLCQTQAGSIQPVRRAVISNTDQTGNLNRRWWFFFAGSLQRLSPREEYKRIKPSKINSHAPATDCYYQQELNRIARKAPEYVQVSVSEPAGSGAASDGISSY